MVSVQDPPMGRVPSRLFKVDAIPDEQGQNVRREAKSVRIIMLLKRSRGLGDSAIEKVLRRGAESITMICKGKEGV